jgi:hypothetical protein
VRARSCRTSQTVSLCLLHPPVQPGRLRTAESTKTYWYDGDAGDYGTALGLIADDSRDAFISALKDELKGREGFDTTTFDGMLSDPASRVTALDDMGFHHRRWAAGELRPR